jgi:acyl-CoA synthetase (AMP-forming)/AMP-acid ligase II
VAVVDEPAPPNGALGAGSITYAELGDMSRSLAASLDDMGVPENARVAIVSPNAARFVVALFGVSAFGRVLVPVNFSPGGELLARSNHVFDGYYEQPEETAKAIQNGWFHTGDGGHLEGPYAVITDRKKDVIITGGENVSSIEVEDCLYQHPGIAEAAVVGIPHEKWGETVLAFVVPSPGVTVTPEDVIAHCRGRMSHYKCPTVVELRDSLPRTATGKLQKFKLREPCWAGRGRNVS